MQVFAVNAEGVPGCCSCRPFRRVLWALALCSARPSQHRHQRVAAGVLALHGWFLAHICSPTSPEYPPPFGGPVVLGGGVRLGGGLVRSTRNGVGSPLPF